MSISEYIITSSYIRQRKNNARHGGPVIRINPYPGSGLQSWKLPKFNHPNFPRKLPTLKISAKYVHNSYCLSYSAQRHGQMDGWTNRQTYTQTDSPTRPHTS